MMRVVTRGQANCVKELGCRVKADDGGFSALGLTSQHRLTYHKQTANIRLTYMTSTHRPRASATARASAL